MSDYQVNQNPNKYPNIYVDIESDPKTIIFGYDGFRLPNDDGFFVIPFENVFIDRTNKNEVNVPYMFYKVEHSVCFEPCEENIGVIYYDKPNINPFLDPEDVGKKAVLKHPYFIRNNQEISKGNNPMTNINGEKLDSDDEDLEKILTLDNFWDAIDQYQAFFVGFGPFPDFTLR